MANFIPARLTGLLIVVTAFFLRLDANAAWRVMWRDAGKTSSPNAGWPEAAMAGALGVRLGGPATYFGRRVDKPTLGDETRAFGVKAVSKATWLLFAVSFMGAVLATGVLVLIHGW